VSVAGFLYSFEGLFMRTLVTGGAGYVGSHTVRRLLGDGHEVWVFDNLTTGHQEAVPADRLIARDLADGRALTAALSENRIEAVLHFAALCEVGESVREPARYYANNVVGSLNLLEAMRDAGVGRIVVSSTCATYGVPGRVPITEDEPQTPINPYGVTKLAIERALADYAAAYGMATAALRYFNAAGAHPDGDLGEDHDPESHIIPRVLQVALGQLEAIHVFGIDYPTPDGTCIRDYVHVDDLADAHLRALERLEPGKSLALNLGTGRGYSVRQVVEAARKVTGHAIPVVEGPRRPGDPPELVACADRAREVLGWEPRYTQIEKIVETAWRWHREHPEGFG
jgi:UDP-glucose 4-epimerase